jgi:hypothetical protein
MYADHSPPLFQNVEIIADLNGYGLSLNGPRKGVRGHEKVGMKQVPIDPDPYIH